MDEGTTNDSFTFTFGDEDMSPSQLMVHSRQELAQVRLQVRESKPVTSLLMVCMSNALEVVFFH